MQCNIFAQRLARGVARHRALHSARICASGSPATLPQQPAVNERLAIQAVSAAEMFDLSALRRAQLPGVTLNALPGHGLHGVAHLTVTDGAADAFVFEDGTVVLWNANENLRKHVQDTLAPFEVRPHDPAAIAHETETMWYEPVTATSPERTAITENTIKMGAHSEALERFALSDAIARSVKLGMCEKRINVFAALIENVIESIRLARPLGVTRHRVLQWSGDLMYIRHRVNQSLDQSNFYWDRPELERILEAVTHYLDVNKRTRDVNTRLTYLNDITELLRITLSEKHAVKLEWYIIALIMCEVGFETLHLIERMTA